MAANLRSLIVLLSLLCANRVLCAGCPSFLTPRTYPAGTGPMSLASGDFNRDGRRDLAVANSGSNTVSILFGNGDGSFQAAVNYAVGTQPASIVAADFNRDGQTDLAVANNGSDNVSILVGVGNGTFLPAATYATGSAPTHWPSVI